MYTDTHTYETPYTTTHTHVNVGYWADQLEEWTTLDFSLQAQTCAVLLINTNTEHRLDHNTTKDCQKALGSNELLVVSCSRKQIHHKDTHTDQSYAQ